MQLTVEALEKQLAHQKLAACYLLASADYFLLQETRDAIWQVASTQEFFDRQKWDVTSQLDWNAIRQRNSCPDLFHRAFIELRCARPLEAETGKKLQQLCKELLAQSVLAPMIVISCAQWTTSIQHRHWFQAIAMMSTLVILDPPSVHRLPLWMNQQLQRVGLKLTTEAMAALVQCIEGNLPAAWQTIQKLALIYGADEAPLNRKQLHLVLEDQATFELFHLTDAILRGQPSRCVRILQQLSMTHTSPAFVLGYLLKVLRTVSGIRYGLDHQHYLPDLFQQYNVWTKQQAGFQRLVHCLKAQDIPILFRLAHHIDRCIKGATAGSSWQGLQKLSLYLADHRVSLAIESSRC